MRFSGIITPGHRFFILTLATTSRQIQLMKIPLSIKLLQILFILVTVNVTTVARAATTTNTVSFHSTALDQETTYVVALPSPLEPNHVYPVLYLLHGATGNYKDWTERSTFTELLDGRDMIVVMPDGGTFAWYLDSQIQRESQRESLISRDLIQDVERRFPVIKSRGGRAIAGLSMGGHGALSLAAKHPDLYGSASSMSGILDITAHPGKWKLDDILGKQPEHTEEWKKHSVLHLADRFTTADVALLFDTGLGDTTGAVEDSRQLHKKLTVLKIPHVYNEHPGTHTWAYWNSRIGEHLDFHETSFKKSQNQ